MLGRLLKYPLSKMRFKHVMIHRTVVWKKSKSCAGSSWSQSQRKILLRSWQVRLKANLAIFFTTGYILDCLCLKQKKNNFTHLNLLFVCRGRSDIWKCGRKHRTDSGEPVSEDFIQGKKINKMKVVCVLMLFSFVCVYFLFFSIKARQ